eukprot:m.48778 g.48778  ORF g.48778 m.48778 type:complete len:176 (-) comp13320_c0_seq2:2322-2849(-)
MADKPRKRIAANSGVMKSILDIQRQRDDFDQKVAKGEARKYEPEPLIRPEKSPAEAPKDKPKFVPQVIQAPNGATAAAVATTAATNDVANDVANDDQDDDGVPRSAFTKSRVDLKSGFMKRIQRHQQTRQQIEQQWMEEQAPEAVRYLFLNYTCLWSFQATCAFAHSKLHVLLIS